MNLGPLAASENDRPWAHWWEDNFIGVPIIQDRPALVRVSAVAIEHILWFKGNASDVAEHESDQTSNFRFETDSADMQIR